MIPPRTVLPLVALVACASQGAAPRATPGQRAVVEALSHRHGADCEAAAAVADDPVADLTWVAENWPDPGWVGVRAAECVALLADDPAYEATAARWTADPGLAGLAEAAGEARPLRRVSP